MTLILKQIFGLLKLINSDKGTNQIAAGVACGLILGFVPAFSLQTILVIFLILFFRIQAGAAGLSAFFFAMPAYLLDSTFHKLGMAVLEVQALGPIYETLYNLPIVPFTRFYNSIVMGSGVMALALFPIVFLLTRILIIKYRVAVVERFQKSKFMKVIKSTSLFKWYAKYDELY